MTDAQKWRIAYLGGDPSTYRQFVSDFEKAYIAAGEPSRMAIFSHVDSLGMLMAVSITPEAVPYHPFSATWAEHDNPLSFGNVGWVAGDEAIK